MIKAGWQLGHDNAWRFSDICLVASAFTIEIDQAPCIAALTFAGVKGTERNRTPTASKTAFAIADGTIADAGSPAPHGGSVGRLISSITTSGTSAKVRMG